MRIEPEPLKSEAARELVSHRDLVRQVRLADADEIIQEAVNLALPEANLGLRMRRARQPAANSCSGPVAQERS